MKVNGFTVDKYNQYGLKDGAALSTCPICSEHRKASNKNAKCMSLDWKRALGTCQHCGKVIQMHTYKKQNTNKVYSKPTLNKIVDIEPKVLEYFSGRGISEKSLKHLAITTSPGWIEFNYYAYGELVNRKSRNGKKQFRLEKDCELVWYNHDALFNHDTIIIVEGEVDALSYIEAGHNNVISVPNGAKNFSFLDSSVDLFDNLQKIYLSMDNDEPGLELQNELIRRLGAEKCYLVDLIDAKDANEYLVLHDAPGLSNQLELAVQVPLHNVKTLNDISNEFEEFVRDGAKQGYQIGLPEFDSVFSTYTSQFIVVTGIPGHGKSDWIDMMAMGYNKKYGWKIAYASPENKPDYIHAHKLWRKHWGTAPTKEDIGTDKWNELKDHLSDNFFFIDMDHFNLEDILKKGSELVKRKGIRCLVIDPYNKVRMKSGSGLSIPDYTMEYLTQIDVWCKKHDCLAILAAHPRKMNRNENGEFDEPTFYDVKGGGEFFDMSYHGLTVHRYYTEGYTKVKVLKCKFQNLGQNGAETEFTWEKKSGRFVERSAMNAQAPWEGVTPGDPDDIPW